MDRQLITLKTPILVRLRAADGIPFTVLVSHLIAEQQGKLAADAETASLTVLEVAWDKARPCLRELAKGLGGPIQVVVRLDNIKSAQTL